MRIALTARVATPIGRYENVLGAIENNQGLPDPIAIAAGVGKRVHPDLPGCGAD